MNVLAVRRFFVRHRVAYVADTGVLFPNVGAHRGTVAMEALAASLMWTVLAFILLELWNNAAMR